MEIIERVARALCKADGHPENSRFEGKPMWVSYSDTARVAVEVMQNPTEAMAEAARDLGPNHDPIRYYAAMITTALARPPQS
ncbi:hypothetical protein ABIC16_002286 [Sphingomonas sp. PvP055]|uniref:hypothetical protein n=1 Tax=Sphingomonas sp. PvP055 TaxID=3156391 RepID=UPI0033955B8C